MLYNQNGGKKKQKNEESRVDYLNFGSVQLMIECIASDIQIIFIVIEIILID
jgi:hypothetical protein